MLKRETSIITVDEALARLQEFYGKDDVKSSSTSKILKDIFVVYDDTTPETKSLSADTLLYVVNYINESGYVILSADENIPEDVLLISETGNVSPSSFYTETDILIDSVLKYSNPENDNCIIGGEPDGAESFILQQVAHYAGVTKHENGAYSDKDDNVSIHGDRDTWNIPTNIRTWKDTMVNVLMKTQWHQRSPYNDNVPSGRYAGCVPIAIAQIMAYNAYPENLSINGTPIVWSKMTKTKNIEEGSMPAQMAAYLIRYIQASCDSWIFKQGTFTFPKKAEKFLKNMGYKNVTRSTSYSEDAVLASLTNKYPVFLAGAQNHNVFKSHGWVVSGVFNSGSSTYNTWYRMITYTL